MTTIQTVQDYLSRLHAKRFIDISVAACVLKDMDLLHDRPMLPSAHYLCDCMASMHMALQAGPAFETFCPAPELRFLPAESEPWIWSPEQAEAETRAIWTGYGLRVDSLRPAGTVPSLSGRNAAGRYKETYVAAKVLDCRIQPGPHRDLISQVEHGTLKALGLPPTVLSWDIPETKSILWRIDPRDPLTEETVGKAVDGYVRSVIETDPSDMKGKTK